jgi:hypothetical protein
MVFLLSFPLKKLEKLREKHLQELSIKIFSTKYNIDLTPPEAMGIMSQANNGLLVSPNSRRSGASHNLSYINYRHPLHAVHGHCISLSYMIQSASKNFIQFIKPSLK